MHNRLDTFLTSPWKPLEGALSIVWRPLPGSRSDQPGSDQFDRLCGGIEPRSAYSISCLFVSKQSVLPQVIPSRQLFQITGWNTECLVQYIDEPEGAVIGLQISQYLPSPQVFHGQPPRSSWPQQSFINGKHRSHLHLLSSRKPLLGEDYTQYDPAVSTVDSTVT